MKNAALLACSAAVSTLFLVCVKAAVVPPAAQANQTERAALQRFLGGGTKVTAMKEALASYDKGLTTPDGTRTAYSGQGSSGVGSPEYAWLGTPDGRYKHIILRFLNRAKTAEFSPDSKALLVIGQNMDEGHNTTEDATPIPLSDIRGLWEFSLESQKGTRLTPHDFEVEDAAYSPDGKQIALYAVKLQGTQAAGFPTKYNSWNNSSVYLMNRDGSHLRRLGPGGGYYGYGLLVWSPDGKHLAVECDTAIDEKTHTQEAWIVRTDGTGSRKLFEVNHAPGYPNDYLKYTNNVHANGKVLTADPAHPLHIDSLSGFVWRDNKTLLVFGLGVKQDDSYTGEIFKVALNLRSIKILRGYQFPGTGNQRTDQNRLFFVEGDKTVYQVTLHSR